MLEDAPLLGGDAPDLIQGSRDDQMGHVDGAGHILEVLLEEEAGLALDGAVLKNRGWGVWPGGRRAREDRRCEEQEDKTDGGRGRHGGWL